MNDDLIITEEDEGGFDRFFVKGRVNSLSANALEYKLNDAFNKGQKNIIVNMMETAFLSSAGIKVLLTFYKKTKNAGGSFYVENPSENVVNVLGMTALDDMLMPGGQGSGMRG